MEAPAAADLCEFLVRLGVALGALGGVLAPRYHPFR